jgi:hypothetical protein
MAKAKKAKAKAKRANKRSAPNKAKRPARRRSPRKKAKRSARKAPIRVIRQGDIMAASGSVYWAASEAGDTAEGSGAIRKRGGRGRDLDEAKEAEGISYLDEHPELTFKEAYPRLLELGLKTSKGTLLRRVWSKRKHKRKRTRR